MNTLNDRQLDLYAFLLKQGNQWTKQEDIAYALFGWYHYTGDNFHDSRARILMTMDIRALNDSESIPKIIVSSPSGVKLATEQEFTRYIRSEYKSVFNKLKRVRVKERKGMMNGQTQLFKPDLDAIEAFLNEG